MGPHRGAHAPQRPRGRAVARRRGRHRPAVRRRRRPTLGDPERARPRGVRPTLDSRTSAARAALDLDPSTTAVLLLGSLTPEKRPALAAAAVAGVPGARLIVVGDGPCHAELLAAATTTDVLLLGQQLDVRPALHAADVMLSTSTTEGMPGSLIEGAMCGVPSVATDVGAVAEVVGGGGVVVPPWAGTSDISAAIADGGRASSLGPAARAHAVGAFSWSAVLPAWLDIIERTSR